jgi:hypothetical protein
LLPDEAIGREFIYPDRGLSMAVLVDSNVLLRSLHPGHPHYAAAGNSALACPGQSCRRTDDIEASIPSFAFHS